MTGWRGRRPDRPLTRHLDALDGFSQVTLLVGAKATSTAGSGALDNAAGMERRICADSPRPYRLALPRCQGC